LALVANLLLMNAEVKHVDFIGCSTGVVPAWRWRLGLLPLARVAIDESRLVQYQATSEK
jgi:hypothetical protein